MKIRNAIILLTGNSEVRMRIDEAPDFVGNTVLHLVDLRPHFALEVLRHLGLPADTPLHGGTYVVEEAETIEQGNDA